MMKKHKTPSIPGLKAPIYVAALLILSGSISAQVQDCDANAKLSVGSATAESGIVDIELRGSSACLVNGLGMAIGNTEEGEAPRVEFLDAEPAPFLTSFDNLRVEASANDQFMVLLVLIDWTQPLTMTTIPEDTLLFTLKYRIINGSPSGPVPLRNETNTFSKPGFPPTANVFTTLGDAINPVLESGVLTIGQPDTFAMDVEATVGSQITLALRGSSTKALRGFSAVLSFDPAVLSVPAVNPEQAFAGTVWANSVFNLVTVGPGTIEIQAFRNSAVPAGVGLPFANLLLDVLACAGTTTIGFDDSGGVVRNQFVDADNDFHEASSGLELNGASISLGGGGSSGFVRGNANGGTIDLADPAASVDLADAIFMLQSLFMGGQAPPCADAADSNDDGRYNLLDPIWVIQFLMGNAGSTLPEPFTEPGDDPTTDTLGCDSPPSTTCDQL